MNFSNYGDFYNLLNKDKDYVAEVDYVIDLFKRYKISGKKVLELGSGTGIHGGLLAKKGFEVSGVEMSTQMIEKALKAPGFELVYGDIRNVNLNRKFDIAISLYHVMSYQTSNEDITSALKTAYNHLNDGGFLVFDVWYSPAVYAQKATPRLRVVEDEKLSITRIANPLIFNEKNVVEVNYTFIVKNKEKNSFDNFSECHPMRHFSIPEIKLLAEVNKFEYINAEAFMTRDTPSEETWGVCFILKKGQ